MWGEELGHAAEMLLSYPEEEMREQVCVWGVWYVGVCGLWGVWCVPVWGMIDALCGGCVYYITTCPSCWALVHVQGLQFVMYFLN